MGASNYGNYFQILAILWTDTSTMHDDDGLTFDMPPYMMWMTHWMLAFPDHNRFHCGLRNTIAIYYLVLLKVQILSKLILGTRELLNLFYPTDSFWLRELFKNKVNELTYDRASGMGHSHILVRFCRPVE